MVRYSSDNDPDLKITLPVPMKNTKLVFHFFLILFIVSCSNDIDSVLDENTVEDQEIIEDEESVDDEVIDEEEIEEEDSEDNVAITEEDFFNYVYKGETVNIDNWTGQKVENTLSITASGSDGNSINLLFNTFGDQGKISSYSTTDFDFPSSGNFAYFTSNFFTFELVNIDEVNKKVEVQFSGKLYEDEYDIESASHEVEGSFIASYVETEPSIANLGAYAQIDGESWYETGSFQTGGFVSGSDITLHQLSDNEHLISITINHEATEEGTFIFNADSSVNSVALSRYDVIAHEFVSYECSGTLIITAKEVGPQLTLLKGKFSLTGIDNTDSTTTEVTDGTFSIVYANY